MTSDLQAGDLLLRHWRADAEADLQAVLRGVTDAEFRRWNTPLRPVNDLAGAKERIEGLDKGQYCITDRATGMILGHIGLSGIEERLRRARVGYWILPEARGRGVATRALEAIAGWGFDVDGLELHRIELEHAVGHDASCRIAEKSGFGYEGTLRGTMFAEGRRDAFRDAHLHARLATD